jgi:hypothetical protein
MRRLTEKHLAVRRLALELMYEWGLLPEWQFAFNARKLGFGLCVFPRDCRPGRIELSSHYCGRTSARRW